MKDESRQEGRSIDVDERRTLARYRDAIGQVGDGFYVMDMKWRLIEVNDALCRMFRCSEADLIGRNPLELVTEASRALMLQTMELVAKTERRSSRYDGVRFDGTVFPALVRAFTHRDPTGAVDSSVGFVTDLSDIVQAEQAIARSQREFAAILDNIQDTYYRTDPQGRLLRVSRSA
jgi:PAS domain S-box-containing protein